MTFLVAVVVGAGVGIGVLLVVLGLQRQTPTPKSPRTLPPWLRRIERLNLRLGLACE